MDRLTEIYFDEFGIKHARLKDNISKKTYRSYTWTPQEIANKKLAELEDFMEKNKCHSVGDLMLEFTISAVDKLNLKLTEEKLAEMKAKLEELKSVAEKENLQHFKLLNYDDVIKNLKQENDQLKQQLAEKDGEIERLKQNYDEVWEDTYFSVREEFELNNNCNECRRYYAEEFNKQLAEKEKEETKRMEDFEKGCQEYYKSNQTAIAELEKVRKQLDCEDNYCYGDNNIVICINRTIFNETIDQQINELKGEK